MILYQMELHLLWWDVFLWSVWEAAQPCLTRLTGVRAMKYTIHHTLSCRLCHLAPFCLYTEGFHDVVVQAMWTSVTLGSVGHMASGSYFFHFVSPFKWR
ncbi:hypothetical protein BDZ94DRAFT_1274466 [Collybia nuda]|uniref:Secreted protein n=1 Tax=Collybia nuda TaxID=64659 RepID=A0A9P5XTV1_9AGAR|nr:hypothetical protein BDZ94DRAFT_1274466 [Collybia nuda]